MRDTSDSLFIQLNGALENRLYSTWHFLLKVLHWSLSRDSVGLSIFLRFSCKMKNGLKCRNMRQDHHRSVNNMSDQIYPISNQIEKVKSLKRFHRWQLIIGTWSIKTTLRWLGLKSSMVPSLWLVFFRLSQPDFRWRCHSADTLEWLFRWSQWIQIWLKMFLRFEISKSSFCLTIPESSSLE